MLRISLKKLVVSFTLISLGVGALAIAFRWPGGGDFNEFTGIALLVLAGALTGTGVMTPFNRPIWGTVLGAVAAFGLYASYMYYLLSLE
jgi:hypothetical protein